MFSAGARTARILVALLLAPALSISAPDPEQEHLAAILQKIAEGKLDGARRELEALANQNSNDARIYNLLGVVAARQNKIVEAETHFRQAINISGHFTGAYLNLGRLYQEHADSAVMLEKGLDTYEKLLDFAPDEVEANYQAASILVRLGRFRESLRRLSRLPRDAQLRAATLGLYCASFAGAGDGAQAEVVERRLIAAPDLTEADIVPIVPILEQHHSADIAARLLDRLVSRRLASSRGVELLAHLDEEQGRLRKARRSLETLLQPGDSEVRVLMQLARVAYRQADLEGSLGYLARARDLESRNPVIHFLFGLICIDLKLPPEATQALREAVRLSPGNPDYNYALGAVLLQQRDTNEAAACFRKYVQARPEDPRGHLALGVTYFDAQQLGGAQKELQFAAARGETRAGAKLYLARIELAGDNSSEAAGRLLDDAIEANPSVPDAYAELALVQIRQNQHAKAESTLKKALTISPEHYRSNLNLLLLYQRTKDPRAAEQARRVEQLRNAGEERERMLLRSLEIRPY